jgi:hypothetical protein
LRSRSSALTIEQPSKSLERTNTGGTTWRNSVAEIFCQKLFLVQSYPDLEKVFRRQRRAPVEQRMTSEMGDNMAENPNVNVEQPRGENEQPIAKNVDYTR